MTPTTESPVPQEELRELEELAVSVAAEAARFVVGSRAAELEVTTKSSDVDIVTVMDARSQELLGRRLREARPADGFFGEEGGADAAAAGATSGLTWVVDPIDGTVNYLYGFPQYAVSVALVECDPTTPGGWRPIAGAVADAVAGSVHHARLGGGAWTREPDGTEAPLHVSDATALATSLVGTGFGYDAAKRGRQARALVEVLPRVRDIRRGGSAALDLCHVAAGRLDGYYEMGINPWDMAAGWIVLTEAGGSCTGAEGAPPSTDCVVAAAPGIREALTGLVDEVVLIVRND
ncbi:inositol monophosphatase family protein [Mobilicoccus pelagius]|uniref:Inositol-1-monophosphatase n=1 Tax=Mobilicoccus pelagius NBRC 104925 TaxID=1089455 RepID=H5UUM9_9MICO|nr:inositol monophosphatase family protein [Mobilicoccus pelagius]GAB49437.1 inositol monophosphatase SuhB [Mobilicoccus pelagius NBRC 104925]